MPRNYPVKVCWRKEGGKSTYKSFDMLPAAQRLAARLKEEGFWPQVFVQGELFEDEASAKSSTYDPRYEIPF